MKDLLPEYEEALRVAKERRSITRKAYESTLEDKEQEFKMTEKRQLNVDRHDSQIWKSIYLDLSYIVEWLKIGQEPTPPKTRISLFEDSETIDLIELEDAFRYSSCPFTAVEQKIDEEIEKKRRLERKKKK